MVNEERQQWAPPYMSFTSFENLIKGMEERGIPARIDRSYLSSKSGSYQSQILSGLRSFDLVDDDGQVQPRLRHIVEQPDARPEIMREIVLQYYAEPLELSARNGTRQQLEEWVRQYAITGATVSKVIAFLMKAAEYAEIELSPHFKTHNGKPRRKRPARRKPAEDRTAQQNASSLPPQQETFREEWAPSLDALKTRYIELLLKRVEGADTPEEALLDRIEVLLGFSDGTTAEEATQQVQRTEA